MFTGGFNYWNPAAAFDWAGQARNNYKDAKRAKFLGECSVITSVV
jgi:hypothetical protein